MFFETTAPSPTTFDSAPLPADMVLTERAAAVLRAYLSENELGHDHLFHCGQSELYDVQHYLAALGEKGAAWESAPPFIAGGDAPASLTIEGESTPRLWHCGILRLAN